MSYYQKEQATLTPRRIVTFDIETVSETSDPSGALDAMTGRVACIGMLIDDAVSLTPVMIADQDERKILEKFWSVLTDQDLLVGHNVSDFDLCFIKRRCWMLGVKPHFNVNLRKYTEDFIFDIMSVWTNWSYKFKGAGLDSIAQALGVGSKSGHGSDVSILWANRQFGKLMDYCMDDVKLAYLCYCKMHFRQPLPMGVMGMSIPTMPGDTRELVHLSVPPIPAPSPAQQKGPETLPTPQAPTYAQPAVSVPPMSTDRDAIFYRQQGSEVILTGKGIFPIKDAMKRLYGTRGEKVTPPNVKPARFEYHLQGQHFQSFAEWCQSRGTPLVQERGAA